MASDSQPKFFLSEASTTGLKVSDGKIYEEAITELRWPNAGKVFKKMTYNSSVASAINAILAIARNAKYVVKTPVKNPSKSQKEAEEFIRSCMGDMGVPWATFITEALTIMIYGFSLHEKVYKYREGPFGKTPSKYNDGKLGWKHLPSISQDSVYKWHFTNNTKKIARVEQDLRFHSTNTLYYDSNNGSVVEDKKKAQRPTIKYSRLLHFKHNPTKGNPEGSSPLSGCYVDYQYLTTISEMEAIGFSRDCRGIPLIGLPPAYMSDNATDSEKAVYKWARDTIDNLYDNASKGMVFPREISRETNTDKFEFKLVGVSGSSGSKAFDAEKMITRYENKILMTFLADVLKMGQDSHGSFAMSDNKTSMLEAGIKSLLSEVLDEINRNLVRETLIINGWGNSNEELPEICLDDLEEYDLEVLGSFLQRVISVGALEVDEELSEWLRDVLKAPRVDRKNPIKPEMIGNGTSDAGRGMKTAGVGNSTSVSGGDKSVSNVSNSTT